MKLLLIDAYALIYRSYYAFIRNPRVNSKGMNTSAIFGFINSLDDALRRLTPTHAAIAFDPAGPTFRPNTKRSERRRPRTSTRLNPTSVGSSRRGTSLCLRSHATRPTT